MDESKADQRLQAFSFYKTSLRLNKMPTTRRKQALEPVDMNMPQPHSVSPPKRKKPIPKKKSTKGSKSSSASRRSSNRLSVKLEQVNLEDGDAEPHPEEGIPDSDVEEPEDTDVDLPGASSGISNYERRRLKNMEENAKFFASLGIFQAKDDLAASSQPKKTRKSVLGLKSDRRQSAPPPPRRAPSLRIQGKTPEGSEIPGFEGLQPTLFQSSLNEEREQVRHPAGPLRMECMNLKKETKEGDDFIQTLGTLRYSEVKLGAEASSLLKQLKSLRLAENRVAKVVPNRSFSIGFHPSADQTILAVGDKWGQLGLWNLDSSEGDDGVFLFSPHVRPINCLRFCPSGTSKIFTCSYDGTVRCGEFEKGLFEEIYTTDEDSYNALIHSFDFLDVSGTQLLVSHSEGGGHVAMVDTREQKSSPKLHRLHDKSIRTVSVHPVMQNYFATASTDCHVALWDTRKLRSSGDRICTLAHGRGMNSAYFSPVTGNKLLTTSADDKLRVFRVEESGEIVKGATLTTSLHHNNQTGRWLTKFRPVWHPRCEELIISGSMARPRRIELFNDKLELLHEYLSEDWLGSVCSLNAIHPTRNIVAGTNSSGRVHVFT